MGAVWNESTNSYQTSMFASCYDVSFCALNLFLWGKAATYLHNGTKYRQLQDENVRPSNPKHLLLDKLAPYRTGNR